MSGFMVVYSENFLPKEVPTTDGCWQPAKVIAITTALAIMLQAALMMRDVIAERSQPLSFVICS